MVEGTDIAYAAGLFDGEGSISIPAPKSSISGKRYHRLHISITSTYDPILIWLQQTFGGCIVQHKAATLKWRAARRWQMNSNEAEQFLRLVRPYLKVKGAQADLALAFRETAIAGGYRLSDQVETQREGLRQQLLTLNKRGI